MTEPKSVFVSYAHEDSAFVQRLMDSLQKLAPRNILFFLDTHAIAPGDDLALSITRALSSADAMIVVMTSSSFSSSFVRSEVAWALARRNSELKILPILRGKKESVPHLLRSRLYLDFSDDTNFESNVRSLLDEFVRALRDDPEISDNKSEAEDLKRTIIEFESRLLKQQWVLQKTRQKHLDKMFLISLGVVVGVLTLAAISIAISTNNVENTKNLIWLISSPATALVGIILGYYFGRTSGRQASADERVVRQKGENK